MKEASKKKTILKTTTDR